MCHVRLTMKKGTLGKVQKRRDGDFVIFKDIHPLRYELETCDSSERGIQVFHLLLFYNRCTHTHTLLALLWQTEEIHALLQHIKCHYPSERELFEMLFMTQR